MNIYGTDWKIGGLYHSPSGSHSAFLDKLEEVFEDCCYGNNFLIVGDFNLDFKGNNFYTEKLKNLLEIFGILQNVGDYTRITDCSKTLIDYALSKKPMTVAVYHVPRIADHSIIGVKLKENLSKKSSKKKIYTRRLDDDAFLGINGMLLDCQWKSTSCDIDEIFENLYENCKTVLDNNFPVILKEYDKNSLPWYDKDLKNKAKERDIAYKKYINAVENRAELWEEYKQKRNRFVNELKIKKYQFYEEQINRNKNNSKKMWMCLRNIYSKTKNELNFNNINFSTNGDCVTAKNEWEAACMFNDYVILSISRIAESIESPREWNCQNMFMIKKQLHQFQDVSFEELIQIVKGIKIKKDCFEYLNSYFLKNTLHTIGHVLLNFVNTSLKYGKFPESLKTSTITPIPKETNANLVSKFRPINSLPCIEKILEKAVFNQILDFFNSNKLFLGNQSGFRKGYSTETAVQLTLSKWKVHVDEGKIVVAVFFDFRRAFETIDRSILLKKLQYYGITGSGLNWFKEYLDGRLQKTKIGEVESNKKENKHGLPQGSILAAILFIIYINDINFVEGLEFINLFADDTLFSCSGKNLEDVIKKVKLLLQRFDEFLKINKLKLNVEKSKIMLVTTRNKLKNINLNNYKLEVDGRGLEWVNSMKYLGFQIDNILCLKDHFEYIKKKIRKKLFFFARAAKSLTLYARITLFKSIIQPHFDYCSSVLYLMRKKYINSLQVLYNRGLRIILRCGRYTPIRVMLKILGWFSVKQRLYFLTMSFIYKLSKGLMPDYFNEFVTLRSEIHKYFTRSRNQFNINRTRYTNTMLSLFHKGLNEFNKVPVTIKNAKTVTNFKKMLKGHMLSSL